MRRTPLLLFASFLTVVLSTSISAQSLGKETLRGLKGVYVLVENLDADTERAGLWKSQIQTDAELKLRKAGVRVATETESINDYGFATLYINVGTNSLKGSNTGLYAFNVTIQAEQMARLARLPATLPPVVSVTYEVIGQFGTVGESHLRDQLRSVVNDGIDTFLNDYLAVNPKP